MKHLSFLVLILTIISIIVLAQDGTYEGRPVYDATVNASNRVPAQIATATFTFTRKFDAPNQQLADRKLATYLAAYAEAKGKSGLCVVAADGACLSENDAIVYDLAKVQDALEQILTAEIDGAARERFKAAKVEAARKQAERDFDEKEEKPGKVVQPRSAPFVPRRRR